MAALHSLNVVAVARTGSRKLTASASSMPSRDGLQFSAARKTTSNRQIKRRPVEAESVDDDIACTVGELEYGETAAWSSDSTLLQLLIAARPRMAQEAQGALAKHFVQRH